MASSASHYYRVIESTEHILRRYFSAKDQYVLDNKHTNGQAVSSIVYKDKQQRRQYHACAENDKGYIVLRDEFQDRLIFVTSQEVGQSELFHLEHDIQSIWNVIKPCSNHEHSTNMTKGMKEWFIINVKYVCLQMFDTDGNIAIFCNTGRSRSPMYLVAYLILFCDMAFDRAIKKVEDLVQEGRGQALDRHCTLHEIIFSVSEIIDINR